MGMHTNEVFEPMNWELLTYQQKRMALRAIIFMKMKRCGRIKTRLCADGRPQREIYSKEDAASPTVKTESVMLTAAIDAIQHRYVAVADIPQAFLKAFLPDETIMRLEGVLADTMIKIDSLKYGPMATKTKSGKTLLFVKLTRALYGNIKASL